MSKSKRSETHEALKESLDRIRPTLAEMEDRESPRLTVDPSAAAETVLGSIQAIEPHRAAMIEQFGRKAGEIIDSLPTIAKATKQADVEMSAAIARGSDLSPMHRELLTEHTLLFTDALSLANRKLIDPARVEAGRSTQGYRTTIHSTLILIAVFREHWSTIASITPVSRPDLDRAEAAAERMLIALGEREQGIPRSRAVETRNRALRKLIQQYDQVRRMLTYLRWSEDDLDTIAPSLWAGRTRRTSDIVPAPEDGGSAPTPTPPPAPSDGSNGPV